MTEVLFIRHAKSHANNRDFAAFGNVDSPLLEDDPKGVPRARALNGLLKTKYKITPEESDIPVAVSTYKRTQQTLKLAGFNDIYVEPFLDETVFDRNGLTPEETVQKHVQERWAPDEAVDRVGCLFELIRDGDFPYRICGSHGILVATVKLKLVDEAVAAGLPPPFEFDPKHGYIPDFGDIVAAQV